MVTLGTLVDFLFSGRSASARGGTGRGGAGPSRAGRARRRAEGKVGEGRVWCCVTAAARRRATAVRPPRRGCGFVRTLGRSFFQGEHGLAAPGPMAGPNGRARASAAGHSAVTSRLARLARPGQEKHIVEPRPTQCAPRAPLPSCGHPVVPPGIPSPSRPSHRSGQAAPHSKQEIARGAPECRDEVSNRELLARSGTGQTEDDGVSNREGPLDAVGAVPGG